MSRGGAFGNIFDFVRVFLRCPLTNVARASPLLAAVLRHAVCVSVPSVVGANPLIYLEVYHNNSVLLGWETSRGVKHSRKVTVRIVIYSFSFNLPAGCQDISMTDKRLLEGCLSTTVL